MLLMEVGGDVLWLTSHARHTAKEKWDKAQRDLVASISAGIARVCAT
jgi:hypothetical protein